MARIGWISDLDQTGSGYQNLTTHYCNGLVERGHEIKVIGLHYRGEEHYNPFSIIPSQTFQDAYAILQNFVNLWKMEVLIVALDIPIQEQVIGQLMKSGNRPFKYIGIMPVEADPLCLSWAMVLMQMDKALIISKFGVEEAKKAGVMAVDYLRVGVDRDFWKPITAEERKEGRNILGIGEDTFTILSVADNQERKNLWAGFEAIANFIKLYPDADLKYLLVTREHSPVGFRLRDLADEPDFRISNKLMIFERGLPKEELRRLYGVSDMFMLTSKAEGLGLPLLEAMSMGLPCVVTDCTGMTELMDHGKNGKVVPAAYVPRDPFGNGRRYWINTTALTGAISEAYHYGISDELKENAEKAIQEYKWDEGYETLDRAVREVLSAKVE